MRYRLTVQIVVDGIGTVGAGGPEPRYTFWTSLSRMGWRETAYWRLEPGVATPWEAEEGELVRVRWDGQHTPGPAVPTRRAVQITWQEAETLRERGYE